jgi:hypothetical protein
METEMRKTILALAAVLMTSGVALANDYSGNLQYDTQTTARPFYNDRYGDAAPPTVVVKQPSTDYTGSAAISSQYSTNGPTPTNEFDR